MNDKIKELLDQISDIEDEIEKVINEQQEQILYFYEDGKIKFKEGIEDAHKKLKKTLLRYILDSKLRNILSAPFIYSMIIPFVMLDISISLYQTICFRLYRINEVNRSAYIVIDRYQLKHLNSIERFNCIYCGYGNGVINYAREVAARTEQYWCPIKHARKVIGRHSRYNDFIDYGDAENYHERLAEYRQKLGSN
ncbi:MAG: hypothetical protein HND53_12230 [Proteobacteria bacterium]|nr:hypothetical protein [Pseudomonadota bacterium]NOG61261.1 hypothetical protein [Pseudomonadota bacterium]